MVAGSTTGIGLRVKLSVAGDDRGLSSWGAPVKSSLGQTSTASPVRTSGEIQLGACACNRRSTRRWGPASDCGRRCFNYTLARGREDPLNRRRISARVHWT
jgi:hypothetical protein